MDAGGPRVSHETHFEADIALSCQPSSSVPTVAFSHTELSSPVLRVPIVLLVCHRESTPRFEKSEMFEHKKADR